MLYRRQPNPKTIKDYLMKQLFKGHNDQIFEELTAFPGSRLATLAEPVPEGSIHRLKMNKGAQIPPHTHPSDEYVYVLTGKVITDGRACEKGAFWHTPAGTRQGPHIAETDVEIITIRLGSMGEFDEQ
jgi:quercetin dioxygenase-like cupin family protein